MTIAARTLPQGYAQSGEINLKENKRLAVTLNIVAFFVGVLSFYLATSFAALVRPSLLNTPGRITPAGVAGLVGLVILFFILHEFIHGFFFWVFTRSRPVFALRLFYAYAAAPDWYIPARQFALVALGPLVIMDAVGLLLILLVPESWLIFIVIVLAFGTGGSIGDLFIFTRLFKLAPTCLARDSGDAVFFYEKQSTISKRQISA